MRLRRHSRTNLPEILAPASASRPTIGCSTNLPTCRWDHRPQAGPGRWRTAVGGTAEFAGSLGTQVVKVFELALARTGLRDQEAQAAGFALTVGSTQFDHFDHKAYYPGAHQLHLRLTGDRQTGRLLSAQLVGHQAAEVAKRIDIPAGTLFRHMTVEAISDLDLSQTPPFGSPGMLSSSPPMTGSGI